MRLSNLLVSASLAGALLTACTTDEIAIPRSELYAREFIKKFGVIDPNRDLSAATHSGINVVTTSPTDVKVYADINGKRYLFAEGRKISGTTPIKFDVPKSVKEVIVEMNGRLIKTPLGGTVRANSTGRAIWEKKDNVVEISRTDYRGLTDEGVMAFKDYLPEDKDNLGKVTQNFSFVANGDFTIYPVYWCTDSYNTLGIYYIDEEKNEMVHIPFYTNKILPVDGTQGNLLYTLEDPYAEDYVPAKDNIPLIDATKPLDASLPFDNQELKPADFNNNGLTSFLDFQDEDWYVFKRRYILKLKEKHQYYFNGYPFSAYFDINYLINDSHFDPSDNNGRKIFVSDIEVEAKDDTHVNIVKLSMGPLNDWKYPGEIKDSHPSGEVKGWKSRGIHVSIAPGTQFGMYIRTWYMGDKGIPKPSIDNVDIVRLPLDPETGLPKKDQYRRFYSEAKYNPEIGGSNVFGATYMYEAPTGTYRVLGFEDYGGDVHDLNDMMFFISSEIPQDIPSVDDKDDPDPEVYQWMIAAEDLAGTYDWDFNDAVFAVSATTIVDGEDNNSTKTEITVEPLAAGGTLPIYVMFNGTIADENGQDLGTGHFNIGPELHKWLGGHFRTPINVDSPVASAKGNPLTFTVNGQWSLTEEYKDNPQWSEKVVKGMGGFYVLVNPGNGLNQLQEAIIKFDPALLDDENHYHMVTPPKSFNNQGQVHISPEMLCMEANWCWPMEEVGIHTVYYNFEQWLRGEAAEWYSDPATWNPAKVVSRK
ncbi:MAG: hypothetical protein K2F88_00035 [Duncaniella sp.]|nr:hypothetical protein [Duncaniella sp.]